MLKLLYFAGMREALGTAGEDLPLPAGVADVAALVEVLRARGDRWPEAFKAGKPWRVAVNQQMASPSTPVKAGDEVAFFPPVTGG